MLDSTLCVNCNDLTMGLNGHNRNCGYQVTVKVQRVYMELKQLYGYEKVSETRENRILTIQLLYTNSKSSCEREGQDMKLG